MHSMITVCTVIPNLDVRQTAGWAAAHDRAHTSFSNRRSTRKADVQLERCFKTSAHAYKSRGGPQHLYRSQHHSSTRTSSPGPMPSDTSSTSTEAPSTWSWSHLNTSLLVALAEQFHRECVPWIQELVLPLLEGPPQPLTDTLPPEQLADRDSRFITVNGIRVHYKIRTPGWELQPPNSDAAPTLVLMHGLNGSTFSWRLLMDDLAVYVSPGTGGCRVIAYDRPPYGLSQRPWTWASEDDNPYSLEAGARLAVGLLDAEMMSRTSSTSLSPPPPAPPPAPSSPAFTSTSTAAPTPSSTHRGARAVLVGHSAGAVVAVETALRYPDRVGGLVLISPAISTEKRGFLARADLGQLLRFAWTRALLSADGPGLNYVRRQIQKRRAEMEAGRLGIYADEREIPQEVIEGYLRPLRAQDWDRGTLAVYRSLPVAGSPPPLEQLRVPVLVLQGSEDRAVPLRAAEALSTLLRARGPDTVTEMVVLEGCGHVPMDEQPLEVLRAVVDFVNRHCCGH